MTESAKSLSYGQLDKEELLKDYELVFMSREASLLGRKEVLGGKAKFGIFGDGKELAQIAMAKVFRSGDWRSGYYRDQTFMFASETSTLEAFFAQLYADTNLDREPHSGGRQMNCHYATRYIDKKGQWLSQVDTKNVSSDISSTGGQMARLLGLAYASKLYRDVPVLKNSSQSGNFSKNGKELVFGTIGNASTSEGHFWEVMNACGVLKLPVIMSVWDDGYGISVPNKYQTIKESISEALAGFKDKDDGLGGFLFYEAKGSDYLSLRKAYKEAEEKCRKLSKPCLIHVNHLTQPQGHSTSGSHERYKSEERLNYEKETDCLTQFRKELLENAIVSEQDLEKIEEKIKSLVFETRTKCFENIQKDRQKEKDQSYRILDSLEEKEPRIEKLKNSLESQTNLSRAFIHKTLREAKFIFQEQGIPIPDTLEKHEKDYSNKNKELFQSHLFHSKAYQETSKYTEKTYYNSSKIADARTIIRDYFDKVLERDPRFFIIGEDVGKLGGVNLEFEGLQERHGKLRVTDTGIREASILGQGIGSAMRGLKPLVDIQYLDYLIYCLQGMTDDLATLHYRTKGGQSSPCIVRTKGHRLEGIWHTGSPISMLLGSLRGIHLCVPRNAVQACGMYETLLQMNDPALVIEVLNGYRLKEKKPDNLGSYTVELGIPEILKEGSDITVVTYGACVRVAEEASKKLEKLGISIELIDVQTLLPFDKYHKIGESVSKTHAVIFMDEDVPGGASSYMMREVLETQNTYEYLDAKPRTLTASENRAAYASDGDYYCKPSLEDLVELAYEIMRERKPYQFS